MARLNMTFDEAHRRFCELEAYLKAELRARFVEFVDAPPEDAYARIVLETKLRNFRKEIQPYYLHTIEKIPEKWRREVPCDTQDFKEAAQLFLNHHKRKRYALTNTLILEPYFFRLLTGSCPQGLV